MEGNMDPANVNSTKLRTLDADSSRMGKAAEFLVASICMIASRAEISVSTALVDDEGVDLVFHRRDNPSTLAVQVKARFSDAKTIQDGTFRQNVRRETCGFRGDFYLLFVLVDVQQARLRMCWLVPSYDFVQQSRCDNQGRYRFVASTKETSNDQWSKYRLSQEELPGSILRTIAWVDGSRRKLLADQASVPPRTPEL
jgi:hypothetical protein